MKTNCHFCHQMLRLDNGIVDIGGLELCIDCYGSRKSRTTLPCSICCRPVSMSPNPLATGITCPDCYGKMDLYKAYEHATAKMPCDKCFGVSDGVHHATCDGRNLCHNCYSSKPTCTQLYRGDRGYPITKLEPSIEAALLPNSKYTTGLVCVVCKSNVSDPAGLTSRFGLPAICSSCEGPKWWDYMGKNREALKTVPVVRNPFYGN